MKKYILMGGVLLAVFAFSASFSFAATPNWDITGTWTWVQRDCPTCSNSATHTMTIDAGDFDVSTGDFTGTGIQVDDPTNTWTVLGNVDGNSINFTLKCDNGSHYAGYVLNAYGTIALDGKTMEGSGTDSYARTTPWTAAGVTARAVARCPADTNVVFKEIVYVPSDGKIVYSNNLVSGAKYLFEASKTYVYWPSCGEYDKCIADAKYSLRPSTSYGPGWISGDSLPPPWKNYLEILVNDNPVDWGNFNSAHIYKSLQVGSGSSASFRIKDSGYSDNTGDLKVNIYSCDPKFVTNKDECKNDGWKLGLEDGQKFKNQGDCVSYFATKRKNQPAGN